MKKTLKIIFILLLVTVIVISSYFIYKELHDNKIQEDIFDELSEIVSIDNNEEKTEMDSKKRKLNELYNINSDIVGWISIEDTNIDYPVMFTPNSKNYYLRRNFYKDYSQYGTPYISENCNLEYSNNLIIYGHNTRNNKMFGNLEKYKSKDFYESHKYIEFETLDSKNTYQVLYVFKTSVYNNNTFKYYNYSKIDDKDKFEEFKNKCEEVSLYKTDIEADYTDNFITLSTCEYSRKNGRMVVIGRKI